jgi:hypothetical protein
MSVRREARRRAMTRPRTETWCLCAGARVARLVRARTASGRKRA